MANATVTLTVRDIPQLRAALHAAAEVVRVVRSQGFIAGDSADVERLRRALECVSPRLNEEA